MAVDLSTKQKVSNHGARLFEKTEHLNDQVDETFDGFPELFKAAHALDMIGDLRAMQLTAAGKEIQGLNAQLKSAIIRFHYQCVEIAEANGVDTVTGADGRVIKLGGGSR